MSTNAKLVKADLSPEAAQLLWACAFDDDDLAGPMLDMFVLAGAARWYPQMGWALGGERVRRCQILERELRIQLLRQEEEVATRIRDYAAGARSDDDEVPF